MAQKYRTTITPRGYMSKIAADVLPSVSEGVWLTPGSQNVLIGEDGTTESRKGYSLIGQEGESGGVYWSDTWMTNTNAERPMRTLFDTLQVYYDGEWRDVKAGFGNNIYFSGASWWDKNENMDKYIFVNGTTKIYAWQGAIAEVAERVSGSSIRKTNGATPTNKEILLPTGGTWSWGYPTVTQNDVTTNALKGSSVGKNFWDEGFREGDTINITIAAISGTKTIASVDAVNNEILVTVAFGSSGTSTTVGEGVIGTVNAYGPLAKTFAQERFQTYSNKRFVMDGVVYTYTGGENTDTLTGITPTLPVTIPAGTLMFSDIVEVTPSGGDYSTGATPDILTVSRNQAYIAQSTRNWVWLSNQDNYGSYAYTTPVRINGEGGSARLDKNITAIWPNQDDTIQVSCGSDIWYPISLVSVTSNGTPGEEVRVGTPKKGSGVGANNQFSVCNTKNGIVYLSTEPTIDYLQAVFTLNTTTLPISDPIEFDLQSWDLTGAKMIYWRKYIWLLAPQESKLIGYDMDRRLWQPPQIVAGNCLSIIDEWLAVHSSTSNETYKMFDGTNDNGLPFVQRAVYSYMNGGTRSEYKVLDGYYVEAKVTPATDTVYWYGQTGYKGSIATFTGTFGSNDGAPFVEIPQTPSGFGGSPFGGRPFGSFFTSDEEVDYRKVRKIFPMTKNSSEFFELQVYFECDKLDAQFKIISHGENMTLSGSYNSNLIDN